MNRSFLFLCLALTHFLSQGQNTWYIGETALTEYDLVSGVNIPWELTWGPDDMLWCTTREGDVLRIDPATGAYEIVLSLNVNDSGVEPGLLGMALHPNFGVEPLVYLVYTAQDTQNGNHERLSVFYWDGTSLGNEQILHIVGAAGIHNGSRLLVLPDNTLLMSTGDMGDGGVSSQNDNSDNGKILRFNLDGSVPADNPDPSSYVYTKGHRNSQGLCVGPNGVVYSSEHGQYNSDEFNILEAGRNYGWPNVEGACDGICDWCNAGAEESFCETNNVPEPLKTWSPCAAVNDLIYYDHPAIPEWQGSVLMAVLGGFSSPVGGRLEVLHMSEDGLTLEGSEMFFTELNQRVRDVAINPHTGAIYLALNGPSYTGNGPNVIKEFRPSCSENGPELASLPLDWVICENGSLMIDGAGTPGPYGGTLVYSWNNNSVPPVFDIVPNAFPFSEATLFVTEGTTASSGGVTLTAIDQYGCTAEVSATIDILDLPVAVNAAWSDAVLCSGQVLTLNLDDITTDATLTGSVTYTWSVTGSNGVSYTVSNVGTFQDEVTDLNLSEASSDNDLEPVTLDLALNMDDGTCENQQSWSEVVALIPNDALGNCGGSCGSDINANGVCDDQEAFGCTYPLAENFDAEATDDDGSCIFPCDGEVNTNVFDWDGDYVVTVTDFLMMLSVYGDTDVDLDGVWDSGDDCVDTNACNYATDPSEPCAYIDVLGICGGGCAADEDEDGVCDDVDDCVGVIDECGVCNGLGATEVVIEDITISYDSVYAEQIDTWFVFEIGADTTFSYTCDCVDPINYQGYDYAIVLIGDQCWFAENLRNENYRNGDEIIANSGWSTTTSGAAAVYGGNLDTYGRLYNGYAVGDSRSLCPNGWHVPTDDEWTFMTEFLGGEAIAGSQMKADYGWQSGGNGTNSSGFSGLPGGYRFENGSFSSAGITGIWWSSSGNSSSAWSRQLSLSSQSVNRSSNNLENGFSVRCVRDVE